jgi:hypothetical protein
VYRNADADSIGIDPGIGIGILHRNGLILD